MESFNCALFTTDPVIRTLLALLNSRKQKNLTRRAIISRAALFGTLAGYDTVVFWV